MAPSWDLVADIVIAVCILAGALTVLLSAAAMFRARDALSRINVFSPATGLGLPLIVVAAYVHTLSAEGFSVSRLLMAVFAFISLIVVSSVASNTLSRSVVMSGSPIDARTVPNRLAQPRQPED